MNWLYDALDQGPLLADGAMGTMLLKAGLTPGASAEMWNVDRPGAIEMVHRLYVEAGARVITTNSFQGSPLVLAREGRQERAAELSAAAVGIARRAVGNRAKVLGDVGPFGGFLEPYGDTTEGELRAALRVQLHAFRDAGADGVIVETMSDPTELAISVRAAKEAADWPVVASYAFQRSGAEFRTMMGATVEDAMAAAIVSGADAVGANCGTGLSLDDYEELTGRLLDAAKGHPVIVQPNAGAPEFAGDEVLYPATPEDMARWACQAVDAGVQIVGGCCGTTPTHLKAMAEALRH